MGARLQRSWFRLATVIVDASPDAIRFGFGHAARRRVLERPLRSLGAAPHPREAVAPAGSAPRAAARRVALVTRTLGTGGVEAVVATLAEGLSGEGWDPIVVCQHGGETADRLRGLGIEVIEAPDAAAAASALGRAERLAVAQLHNAPDHLIEALAQRRVPLVPVIHTTDINLRPADWAALAALLSRCAAVVAVSETVRDFVLRRLPHAPAIPFDVIPNGVGMSGAIDRAGARARLADVAGVEFGDAPVFVTLARYDIQKNVPGLVDAFLAARDADAHLVVAGPVGDWLEYAHADAVRRSSVRADRVHLLGSSAPGEMIAAADAFLLDSFFEGWPVAASEAVAAGLPVVTSDVGGAHELVGSTGDRGSVCANPATDPVSLTLADIRRARRSRTQANRAAIADAIDRVALSIDEWRSERTGMAAAGTERLSAAKMIAAHARTLSGAADEQGAVA